MIRVRSRGIQKVAGKLRKTRRAWPRQAAVALNESQRQTRQATIEAIREISTLKLGKARQAVQKGKKASPGRYESTIQVSGEPIGLQHFSARATPGRGVTFKIRRKGGKETLQRAFAWNGNFFQRVRWHSGLGQITKRGNPIRRARSGFVQRLPIVRLEGPRAASLLTYDRAVRRRTMEEGNKILKENVRKRWRKLVEK